MQKGYAHYAPHEATIFLLKALLLSFWFGIDVLSAVFFSIISVDHLAISRPLMTISMTVMIFGTVFSVLFVWMTGSLFGRKGDEAPRNVLLKKLNWLKQRQKMAIGSGALSASLLSIVLCVVFTHTQPENEETKRIGRASTEMAEKCAEVTRLERKLFHSDELTVMAECLIQYDKAYASLWSSEVQHPQ